MPRMPAAVAAATARRVLDSAAELFAVRGFSSVSLDDVAASAGVTRGAIYHHYRSKAGLFAAVAARLQSEVADAVAAAADSASAEPREQLRVGCHEFLDAITSAARVRVLLVDGPAVVGWAEWRRLDAENSMVHLREALDAAGVGVDILDATTVLLSGAMNEAALWVAEQRDDAEARQQAHRVLDRLLAVAAG